MSPLRSTFFLKALLPAALLTLGPAGAAPSALLDAVRLYQPDARALASAGLQGCVATRCAELPWLSLLVGTLALSEGDAAAAEVQLASVPPPPLLEPYHAFYLAQARFYGGHLRQAAEGFSHAADVTQPPLQQRARARAGEAWLAAGRADLALPLLDQAVNELSGPELLYERAQARRATGDLNGARDDFRALMVRYAMHPLSAAAVTRLQELPGPKVVLGFEERLARVRQFLDGGEPQAAQGELDIIEKFHLANGALARGHVLMERGLVRYAQNSDVDGDTLMLRAAQAPAPIAAQALLLRAKRHLKGNSNNPVVQKWMVELEKRYPREPAAEEAGYLSGWLLLQSGSYDEAAKVLATFGARHPHSHKRDDAVWFQGLALVRGAHYAEARAAFEALSQRFPRSQLLPQARYWSVRCRQLGGDAALEGAYGDVIKLFPGSLYALLSAERLRELGKTPPVAFPHPPATVPVPVPLDLNLALALARAGLVRDAGEEVARRVAAVHRADVALPLGQALAQMGENGYAYALAARLLWGAAYGERNPLALALLYPRAFASTVEGEAAAQGVNPYLLWALMRRESAFQPFQLSGANARGLMQLVPRTATAIAKELHAEPPDPDQLFAPVVNLHLSAWYVAQLVKRFVHPALCAAAYNAGPPAASRWADANAGMPVDLFIESIPYKETRAYVKQVVADYFTYQSFYSPKPDTARLAMSLPKPSSDGINF